MSETKTLHDKLIDIQQRLSVPKTRENEFGGFNYRNVEDIENAVKPFLKEHNLSLTFSDEMVGVEGRVYVKATAYLMNSEGQSIEACAYAREATEPKKKTDDAQLTGGCSSYARKYAACGLFLIDDGKGDPDVAKVDVSSKQSELSDARAEVFAMFTNKGYTQSEDMVRIIKEVTGEVTIKSVGDAKKVLKRLGKDDAA